MKSLFVFFTLTSFFVNHLEGKTPVHQSLRNPSNPLILIAEYARNTSGNYLSENSAESEALADSRVQLPSLPCQTTFDCKEWDDPALICRAGQCTCKPPYCWVYHYESSGWYSRNVFSCGTCGQLGSWCNETNTCNSPGECFNDGYCHCSTGENFSGICVVVDQSWTLKVTLGGFGIIFLIALLVILYNCWRTRPWQRPGWCWGVCNKTGSSRRRRGSCEKSPAFTTQHFYASQIYVIDDDTSQNQSEVEVFPSTSTGLERFRHESNNDRIASGSLTSVETETTNVSDNSIAGNATNIELEGAYSLPIEPSPAMAENENIEFQSSSNPSLAPENREDPSAFAASECKHERCHLCLPKGISTRPSDRSSGTGTSNRALSTIVINEPDIEIKPQIINNISGTRRENFECTRL